MSTDESRESVKRLSKDILAAAGKMSRTEARYLVDAYYISQEDRKRAHNQTLALASGQEPNLLVGWLAEQSRMLENQMKRALDRYTDEVEPGPWLKAIYGIGPVIAAGLIAHIDIEKAPTVGHIWRFAGLDPTDSWGKGEKRPWNADLKVLCWKAGQSFMKFAAHGECTYGRLYRERKAYEIARNDRGDNRELALQLAAKFAKGTEARGHYEAGHLPPAQIDARARRWAVKQFLADLHGYWYRQHFGKEPPLPYPIAILGHAHIRRAA